MGGSERPSFQSVQRSLIIGVIAGIVFGCILGTIFGTYYAWIVNPAVYADGAFPSDMSNNYQGHYIATVTDSYIVNRQVSLAQDRLSSFDQATKIRALGERSASFVANGQAVEAQLVNELAANLKTAEGWSDETVQNVIAGLSTEYQGDTARAQAINTFSAQLLGAVPEITQPAPEGDQAAAQPAPAEPAPAADTGGGGISGRTILLCLLGLVAIVGVILIVGRWQFNRSRAQPRHKEIEWTGEGPAPIRVWTGTYTLGQNNYDEFFTIETHEGDFLGESGMGIMKAVPGSNPKQVTAFDVGLFDKTDITTLSRVVMSEDAFQNDVDLRNNIESNPQAEAILAEPGKEFTLETSALRVAAKIDELVYGEGNKYFETLKVTLNVFLREGVDLRIGEMDVPEEFQG